MAGLTTEVDKSNTSKSVPVSVCLSKLSEVVKNDLVKKTVYNNIDTSRFVLKTKYQADKAELAKNIAWCNWSC